MVKITLKDLPLHSVGNEDVLEVMHGLYTVTSPVNYSNLWFEGKVTSICNGDCYLYIAQHDVSKLPDHVDIGGCQAGVFKPVSISHCKCCDNEGHCPSDPNCPARATEEVQDTVENFRGSKCVLSNLHVCLQGCEIEDLGTTFPSSEQHYQFKKLKAHDKGGEAYEILMEEDGFKAM